MFVYFQENVFNFFNLYFEWIYLLECKDELQKNLVYYFYQSIQFIILLFNKKKYPWAFEGLFSSIILKFIIFFNQTMNSILLYNFMLKKYDNFKSELIEDS